MARRGPIPKKPVITTTILKHRQEAESLLEPKDERTGKWDPEIVVAAITYRATDMPFYKIAQELSRVYGADVPVATISKWWHAKGKDNVALQEIVKEQKEQWIQRAFTKVFDLLDMIDLEELESETVLTKTKILGILVDKIGVLLPRQTITRGVSGIIDGDGRDNDMSESEIDEEISIKMKRLGQVVVSEKRTSRS